MSERPPVLFKVCIITNRKGVPGGGLVTAVDRALKGGPSSAIAVQLREKDLPTGELCDLAVELRKVTRSAGALLIVNDRADVALASGADGVHLPTHSLSPPAVRKIVGRGLIIGCSTHSLDEARQAREGGADYATFGPVYPTPSKAKYGPPVGLPALKEAASALPDFPLFALGGVTVDRVAECRTFGAAGVAAIRAIVGADDPTAAAAEMVRSFLADGK